AGCGKPRSGCCTRTDRERTPSPACSPKAHWCNNNPTGATTTPEEPCAAEPVTVKSCSAELVSVRHGDTDRDQEKPCLTEPGLKRPCSVDSGAVLELPVLAEAGTEVQSCRLEAPVTTPVHEDGGDVEMEDEPTFKVPTKRKRKVIEQDVLEVLRDSMNVGQLLLSCRRAVLILLPKKGDLTHLKNCHAVSLLCTDIMLLSKALALRLTKVMEQITHQDQSYCVIDQEKAFDRVEHEYLWKVLETFEFNP
ncbi:hypothetical protein QTP86_017099, partial [Hemibagrus guttatus]